MADGTINDDPISSVASTTFETASLTSLWTFIVPVLVLFATVAWWKRQAPAVYPPAAASQ